MVGLTQSTNFPVTSSALQPTFPGGSPANEGFLARVTAASGNPVTLAYSTYLGVPNDLYGYISGTNIVAVAVDGMFNAYVAGDSDNNFLAGIAGAPTNYGGAADAIVARIDTSKSRASSLGYANYIGGTA